MAFCEQCGAQIADDSVFCEQCGTRQSAIARQIPAVEVDPREESAEETPLPEQPVGGNRSIRLCPDGKYRWFYEFSMLKNPTVIFTCLNCGLVPVSVITLSSIRHGLVEALGKGVSTYLMLAPLFAGLAAAGYLILATLYGWKYLVLLRWMNLASSTSSKTSNSVRRRASLG